jgi:hypothetical protein
MFQHNLILWFWSRFHFQCLIHLVTLLPRFHFQSPVQNVVSNAYGITHSSFLMFKVKYIISNAYKLHPRFHFRGSQKQKQKSLLYLKSQSPVKVSIIYLWNKKGRCILLTGYWFWFYWSRTQLKTYIQRG